PMPPTPPTNRNPRDRAWVEVHTPAIRRNLERVRAAVGGTAGIIPMVKADGYGLGVRRVVAALGPARPFGYGVATVAEGLELRRIGVHEPVMLYSPVLPGELRGAVRGGLIPSISDLAGLAALRRLAGESVAAAPIPFQIEVDTGMGRAGFGLQQPGWWSEVRRACGRGLRLFGVFTHLHSADQADPGPARRQIERFDRFVEGAGGIPADALLHCANSAGALRLGSRTANAVRPGIYLYGAPVCDADPPPDPVASVRARVVLARDVPAGATLGYGATYRSREPERWATAAIGYGDGLPRVLGNRGCAIAGGERVPIVGRISMDTTVLRTGSHVGAGDVVTFVGRDSEAEVPLEAVAELAGTIPYEILTGLTPRLPRINTG
ncbi:MAG: alanine racemase, partial [Gemmatimonadetes bacterium]|nr:alanine racemase [Gemmatimonadota bacterium]